MTTLSKLSKLAFHSEPAAFEYLEATLWPDGPVCPHCGTVGNATKLQRRSEGRQAPSPDRPMEVQRKGMPQAVHGQSRHRFRAWPHSPPQDASSGLPAVLLEKGLLVAPAPPHPRDHLQGGLVPLASHPRGHAGRFADADRRRRQDRRGGRDLFREQEGLPQAIRYWSQDGGCQPCRARWPDPFNRH